MLEKLIGAQILTVSDDSIEVKVDNEVFTLEIIAEEGNCCGYAEFTTNLFYSENDARNPIITNVTLVDKESEYEGSFTVFTFYGEAKPLATIESEAGSGSGEMYGAAVSLRCKAMNMDEVLASW